MTYNYMRKYLQAKYLTMERSFVDIIQNVFLEGDKMNFTFVGNQPTPVEPSSSFVLPPAKPKDKAFTLPSVKQTDQSTIEKPNSKTI